MDKTIVHLRTRYYNRGGRLIKEQSLSYRKKLSSGVSDIWTDAGARGVGDTLGRIINLNEAPEGLYVVTLQRDEVSYKLIPV
jgi:hypothetical protein